MATAVEAFGGIDVVVNNAGGSMPNSFLDTSVRAFEKAFHFNVTTAFRLTQLAVPHMLGREGASVVNISSAIGRMSDRGFAAYGTAKGALTHLTRLLAADLAPRVRVNGIAVGSVATSALQVVLDSDEIHDEMVRRTPLKRLGDPTDIAAAALWLASPRGRLGHRKGRRSRRRPRIPQPRHGPAGSVAQGERLPGARRGRERGSPTRSTSAQGR